MDMAADQDASLSVKFMPVPAWVSGLLYCWPEKSYNMARLPSYPTHNPHKGHLTGSVIKGESN